MSFVASSSVQTNLVRCETCGKTNRVPAAAKGVPKCGNCGVWLPWILDASESEFTEVVEEATIPVVVDLWAEWCGPCGMVSPALEALARQFANRIKLVKVNVDHAPGLSRRFGVQSIPTLLLMRGKEVVSRQIGAAPEAALRSWLERGLAEPMGSGSASG
jgi:thioredoxin 2